MPKNKNAQRKHYIGPHKEATPETPPTAEEYLWLAKGLKTSSPENNEETDDSAYFDGDGTKEEMVISKKRGRTFEGHRDYSDKAQNFVADKEDEVGDDLVVWYKEVSSDGKTQKEGLARLSEIEIGDGEASELETIKFKIVWTRKPKKSAVVPG
ncbi:TPA: phage tail protein [Streptococcus pneumoniae]|nr:phage tail protein [Streptococcus pneumoniae]HEU6675037.1 phage tail protein [Streptococcus pneumoniae]HEV6650013.1 phage tail protein [Streptococcus pneumoniae]